MHDINFLKGTFSAELKGALSVPDIQQLRIKYLGKKGLLTEQFKLLPTLSEDEKKIFGKSINELKTFIESEIASKEKSAGQSNLQKRFATEALDITLPGKDSQCGKQHPITQVLEEVIDVFVRMGFGVEEGPEVEIDYYNFEALNFPKDHPARDMQDTFFITDECVLRTHTSPVQVRVMEKKKPPLRFIAPGKVYRCDADITHTPMFHQVEGLMVDTHISFSDLKGVLETFIHRIFTPQTLVRFRPSFFPFTEPSAEIDIGCIFCKGKGCNVCKNSGWLEILGAGMVNPRVFEKVGYDPEIYTGFAFGMGIERITMLKYSIDDIRIFFENDLRFLRQF